MSSFVSNEITKLRNAYLAGKQEVVLRTNFVITGLLGVLKDNGFIESFETWVPREGSSVRFSTVTLKYNNLESVIKELKIVSKPGRGVYTNVHNMPCVYNNLGIAVLSTSKGIMSNKEAVRQNVGGEVICTVF